MLRYCLQLLIFSLTPLCLPFVANATSQYGSYDGMARVAIKNEMPCFYLADSKRYITGYSLAKSQGDGMVTVKSVDRLTDPNLGRNVKSCLVYGGQSGEQLEYNHRYQIILNDNVSEKLWELHRTEFCIAKKDGMSKVVQTKAFSRQKFGFFERLWWGNGGGECTDEEWKPTVKQ